MPDFEKAGYQGYWLPGRRVSGEHGVAVVLKRRFQVDMASAECKPAEDQEPVVIGPEFADPESPADSPASAPSEVAVEKYLVDVMLKGKAYAPFGRPTPSFEVSVKIAGALNRHLLIQGDRVAQFVPPKKRLTRKQLEKGERQEYPLPIFGEPEPLKELPLSYEYGFGGTGKLVMEEFDQELADDAQEDAELLEERRKRKKEIEEELMAEEEAKAKEAEIEARKKSGEIVDEETAGKVDDAFQESGTQILDVSMLTELKAGDDETEMKKVSAYRLGRDLPDRPEEADDAAEDEEGEEADEDDDEVFESGTQILDISDLDDVRDELKVALDSRSTKDARKLADKEGALRVQATEFGDIELSDEEWIAKYGAKLKKRKKKKREPSDHPEIPYPANPCGRGFCVSPLGEAVDQLPLPNIEWPDDPLTPEDFVLSMEELDLKALRAPAGMACYPLSWYPRVQYAGVFSWDLDGAEAAKLQALEDYDPDDPEDQEVIEAIKSTMIPVMDPAFYQEAHPRMQVPRVNGDEEVLCTNLTPDGNLFFKLPGLHPHATLNLGKGPTNLDMRIDTLTIDLEDPAQPAVEILWRGWHPIADYSALDDIAAFDVDVRDVDQSAYFDLLRGAETGQKKDMEEGTRILKAMDDSEVPEPLDGDELEKEYKELIGRRKDDDMLGSRADGDGVDLFDQSQDRKLTDDEWDEEIRENKEEVDEIVAKQKKKAKKAKKAQIRKKAREQADEELGIEREEEEEDE